MNCHNYLCTLKEFSKMNCHNYLCTLKEFSQSYVVFMIISSIIIMTHIEVVLSANQRYEACKPRNCGNGPNISYPFWIQEDYCGYPEFRVICRNNEPVIHASGNDYIIKDIFYTTRSFQVENSVVRDETCPIPLRNSTFDDRNKPFHTGPNVQYLSFFYNCTKIFPDNLTYHVTSSCATSSNDGLVSFAMFVRPGYLSSINYVPTMCQLSILEPVEASSVETIDGERDYRLLLGKGFNLEWDKRPCSKDCQDSGGYCGYESSDRKELMCFCVNGPQRRHCNNELDNSRTKILIGTITATVTLLLASFLFIVVHCLRKKSSSSSYNSDHQNMEDFVIDYGSLAPKRFKYKDVKKITNSFKESLGQGGYGSVFKGRLDDGRLVAVKVLFIKPESMNNGEEFMNEVLSISRTSHVNIVSLLGFCLEKNKRALIYEFMPNGSLDKFIYSQNMPSPESGFTLEWDSLYRVAIGIGRGLEYLHRGCNTRILHFDIKPHNILLDEHFRPKISDFGLAKLYSGTESIISMLGTRGTAGYIAPEVFSRNFGRVSHKSDVYSYGMMVLEMVGGRKNIDLRVGLDHSSQLYFPDWIYDRLKLNMDLGLLGIMTKEREVVAKKMIIVGLWCIQMNPSIRPSMSQVLEMLEGSVEALQIPPKPFLFSPPCSPSPPSPTISSTSEHHMLP